MIVACVLAWLGCNLAIALWGAGLYVRDRLRERREWMAKTREFERMVGWR